MQVLVACEYSGAVRRAFRARGHEAWSCDLLPAEDSSYYHHQGDIRDLLYSRIWDLLIAHPPCTYLCRAGWRWTKAPDQYAPNALHGAPRRAAVVEAREFFMALLNAPIPRIAVENPRPAPGAGLPEATQYIQPWQFGHGEVKATGLWLRSLPPLVPTNIVEGRKAVVHRMPPGPDRWKDRSRTYQGIADAMAEQWGSL